MATLNDIDTQAAVRKFLERQVVSNREDESTDSADETRAILEACALSFLLQPQAALSFVLLAKNTLQQILAKDIELLDYLIKTVDDVDNPNELITDTSDLIEAQTALVEIDRIGRVSSEVKAYDRYTAAVSRFLDRQLARSLKRRRKNEFERSGTEAKQDLFRVLSAFVPTHAVMAARLELLAGAVADFEGVDLTRIVATKTVSRVRSSLTKVQDGIDARTLSKTSTAIELLAGAAALSSISRTKTIYDPLVDTDSFPTGRSIFATSEPVAARSAGAASADLTGFSTPWAFDLEVDYQSAVTVHLPASGVSGKPFVLSGQATAGSFTIPVGENTLYLQLDGLTPLSGQSTYVEVIVLPTGSQTLAAVRTAIDSALPVSLGCDVLGSRLVVYGEGAVTGVTVLSQVAGTFDGFGVYTPADLSAHEHLGFAGDQVSETAELSAVTLAAVIGEQVSDVLADVEDGVLVVSSLSAEPTSSLFFTDSGTVGIVAELGLEDAVAEPTYLTLIENGAPVDLTSLGILPGSAVSVIDSLDTTRSLSAPIASIDGTKLYFDVTDLVRCDSAPVLVRSPLVAAVQAMLDGIRPYVGDFGDDSTALQRVLSPLLSRPTLAQVNDAKRVMNDILSRVTGLKQVLDQFVVRPDRNEYTEVVTHIMASLEERGLDRAMELLKQGSFSEFFALSSAAASKSSRLLRAIEEAGRKDFPVTFVEQDAPETARRGTTPEDDILPGEDLSSPEDEVL
jgi:hypothetical protein